MTDNPRTPAANEDAAEPNDKATTGAEGADDAAADEAAAESDDAVTAQLDDAVITGAADAAAGDDAVTVELGDAAWRQALEQRIHQLETENAVLAAAAAATPVSGAQPPTPAPTARRYPRGSWWRAVLSAICIVLATIVVPLAMMGAWARAELVNEDKFVATLGPLASNTAVQGMIVDESMKAIEQQIDFQQLTSNVIDGVAGINGMPPKAQQALELLKQPAASGLQNLVQTGVTKVVQSSAFDDVWNTAVRSAHQALTAIGTYDNTGAFVLTSKGLGLNLGPIIDQVKQKLVAQGIGVADMIPTVNKVIIISDGTVVSEIQTVYGISVTAGLWLPFIALGLFLLGILIARRRSLAVVGSGIGLFIGAGALAIGFDAGATAVGVAASNLQLSPRALNVIYQTLVSEMHNVAKVTVVLGLFIAVLGWALGSWSSSRRLQSFVGGLNSSARVSLGARGLNSGRFGEALYRFRTVVHVIAVAAGIIWLMLLRPISFGDIVLVTVVILLITWVLELLQKRPGEEHHAGGAGSEPEADVAPDTADDASADDEASGTPALSSR